MSLAEWLDLVVAVAAVAGVVVAAVLGSKGLKEARRSAEVSRRSVEIADGTLRRAELDAACQRADVVNDALASVIQQHGLVRAEMHPFWKRPDRPSVQPDGTVYTGPEEDVLLDAEAATHKAIYALDGAAVVLRSSIKALGHLRLQKANIFQEANITTAIAWTEVVNRSVFPAYLALVPRNPFDKPDDPASLGQGVGLDLPDPLTWLKDQLDRDPSKEHCDLDRLVSELFVSEIQPWCAKWFEGCDRATIPSDVTETSSFDVLERDLGHRRVAVHMSTFTDSFAVWALEQLEVAVDEAVQHVYAEASKPADPEASSGQEALSEG